MKNLTALFFFFFLSLPLWGQNYLKNGSFEYGLKTGWTYEVTYPSNAKFSLDQSKSKVMDGRFALRVDVTARSANRPNSIKASTKVTVGNDSIYLLHFWARGPERGELFVEVVGSETKGVLYQTHTGKTMLRLPFKVDPQKTDRELEINFYFRSDKTLRVVSTSPSCQTANDNGATFYIDGIEVLDPHNKQNIDVINTYVWEHNRSGNNIWNAGDNDVSLLLPDGQVLWVFNDSFIGKQNSESNVFPGGTFVRNAVVKQDANGIFTTDPYPITNQGGQQVFFRIPNGDEIYATGSSDVQNFFWVGDMILEDNKVKAYLIEVDGISRSYIASFSYPELTYLGMEKQPADCVTYETFFVDDADNKIYLYRTENTSWFATNYTHVARTNLGNLSGNSTKPGDAWEYWNGSTWTTSRAQGNTAASRMNNGSSANVIGADGLMKLGQNNYAHVSMEPMTPYLLLSFAPAPQGPWTTPKRYYTAPQDSAHWYYMPNFHAQLPNGNYSISFSANFGYCLFFCNNCEKQSFTDKYWYRQRYIQMDLLGLSPYTTNRKDCAGVPNGTAYYDACNECVGGTTGKEPCPVGIAKLYAGTNFTGKRIGLEVGNYSSEELTAMNFQSNPLASIELQTGYLAELFDEDNFGGNSKIISSTSANLGAESFVSLVIRRAGTNNLSGTYRIQNKESGLYMDMENGSAANKAFLVHAAKSESNSQVFEIQYIGKDYYQIKNCGSGLNLYPAGLSNELGSNIQQWDGQGVTINVMEAGGTISAQYSDSPANEGIGNLIDGLSSTKFLTFHNKAWVEFHANTSCVVTRYSLTSANDNTSRDPASWTLQGSNNGTNWTTLDTRSGITFSERLQEQFYDISNTTAYSYYRLDMTCRSGSTLQLAEWRLFAELNVESNADAPMFIIQDAGNGYVKIINKQSDRLLDILEGLENGDTKIIQMFDLNQPSAMWKLESLYVDLKSANGNSKMRLYPNPVENELNLESALDWIGGRFTLYNISGIVVSTGMITGNPMDVSRLNPGYYLLKIQKDSDTSIHNFIKK